MPSIPIPAPDQWTLSLAITEHAPLPMAFMDGPTHILRYANKAFCALLLKPSRELVGRPVREVLPNEEICLTLLDRVQHTEMPETFTERETARHHPVLWSYTMWPLMANDRLLGIMLQVTETAEFHGLTVAMNEALMLGSVRQHELTAQAESLSSRLQTEIAECQRAGKALRESELRYRTLFDMGPVAVYSCDAFGVIQEYNRRAVELWGRRPAVGDTNERFCGSYRMLESHGGVLPPEICPMAKVVSGALTSVDNAEVVIERPEGSRSTVIVNIRQLTDPHGVITGAINCFYDISQHKRLENERATLMANEQAARLEAEAANRSKDLFLATLSHEVRTPLNAILGWASILRSGNCTEADVKEGMEVIERNCKAQAQLIEDVLDISRIVSGKMQLHIAPCELLDVIKEAMDVVRPAADAKGIRFDATLDPAASLASCDAARIQQVIWNLLANAVKFSPKGSSVRIILDREQSSARIQVIDQGQGLTADFLPYVFDRFRQAEGSTRRKLGGLGLGLSIVKHIVELHGGTVQALSEGEGKGATFTILLPVSALYEEDADTRPARDFTLPAVPDMTSVRLDGMRLLVVDDEVDARRLLSKVLRDVGATVLTAGSVKEALEFIAVTPPQVLLSDIAMPGQDGFDLIRQIRAAGHSARELPAVALTAFAHKDDKLRVLLAGFQVHVPKPIDPHELIAVIASLSGRTG